MKNILILLVLVFAIIGCADDKKDSDSSTPNDNYQNVDDNLSSTDNIDIPQNKYAIIIDSYSHIPRSDNMSEWFFLPYHNSALNNVVADKLGRPTDNTTKTVCVWMDFYSKICVNNNYYCEADIDIYQNKNYSDTSDYDYGKLCLDGSVGIGNSEHILSVEISYYPDIPDSIMLDYLINQVKNHPYENRYNEGWEVEIDDNMSIRELSKIPEYLLKSTAIKND